MSRRAVRVAVAVGGPPVEPFLVRSFARCPRFGLPRMGLATLVAASQALQAPRGMKPHVSILIGQERDQVRNPTRLRHIRHDPRRRGSLGDIRRVASRSQIGQQWWHAVVAQPTQLVFV